MAERIVKPSPVDKNVILAEQTIGNTDTPFYANTHMCSQLSSSVRVRTCSLTWQRGQRHVHNRQYRNRCLRTRHTCVQFKIKTIQSKVETLILWRSPIASTRLKIWISVGKQWSWSLSSARLAHECQLHSRRLEPGTTRKATAAAAPIPSFKPPSLNI